MKTYEPIDYLLSAAGVLWLFAGFYGMEGALNNLLPGLGAVWLYLVNIIGAISVLIVLMEKK